MSRKMLIQHNGTEYEGLIGTVRSTMLGTEDHGIGTAVLNVEGDGWSVSVGGRPLDGPVHDEAGKFLGREGSAFGMDHIFKIMRTVGSSDWEGVRGREVIVLYPADKGPWGSSPAGIAHIKDEDRVLIFDDHFKEWRASRDDN